MRSARDRSAWIEETLRRTLEPEHLEVVDESEAHRGHPGAADGGGHYRVTLVSRRFDGESRVRRHRIVYEALSTAMGAEIHALSLDTLTPEEWSRRASGRAG